jgi:CheY-like chemotaxis protein
VGSKPKILVADDDAATREMLSFLLQDEGYEVLCAKNGLETVEAVEREAPDLVLLDLMMPEMDGYEALNALREAGRLRALPILIVSARSLPIYQQISKNLGAVEHVVKPFAPDDLLAKIRVVLAEHGRTAAPDPQAGD